MDTATVSITTSHDCGIKLAVASPGKGELRMRTSRTTAAKRSICVVLLTVCGVLSKVDATETVTRTVPLAPNVPENTRLVHIALGEVTAIAAQKGWLQEELSKRNAKFDMVQTSAYGTAGTSAALFDRGDLHIAYSMINGALQSRAQGLDNVFIWESVNVKPRVAVTMVLKDSNIQSVPELKGKTLGSSQTSCFYYAAVESLRAQGTTVDNEWLKGDMRFVNITGNTATMAFLAGRFDAVASHPGMSTTAPLYIQGHVREVATAVPNGTYVGTAGRTVLTTTHQFADTNPDLVKAFLLAWDRTVRWLYADHGAHLDEAATINSRALRISKSIALFDLKDDSHYVYNWGTSDHKDAVQAVTKLFAYQVAFKDPFYTKHRLSDKEVESLIDKRFFAGGEYFVDTSEKQ